MCKVDGTPNEIKVVDHRATAYDDITRYNDITPNDDITLNYDITSCDDNTPYSLNSL